MLAVLVAQAVELVQAALIQSYQLLRHLLVAVVVGVTTVQALAVAQAVVVLMVAVAALEL